MLIQIKKIFLSNKAIYSFSKSIYSILPLHIRLKFHRRLISAYSDFELDNKIIFVHIPKAAGNGITHSLFNRSSKGHFFLKDYLYEDKAKFDEYRKFTVIRNPWDRFVSAFHYLKSDKGGFGAYDKEFRDKYLADVDDFKSFIDKLSVDSKYLKKVIQWTHFIPQYRFLTISTDLSLEYFDLICRFESIKSDFEKIKALVGNNTAKIKHINRSNHNYYKNYYTEQYMIDFIEEIYKEDIMLLGYSFGKP